MTELLIDVPLTRGRIVHSPNPDIDWDMSAGPVTFSGDTDGDTYLFPVEWDGHPVETSDGYSIYSGDFVPPTPAGHTLTAIYPYVRAHTTAPQTPITVDTSGWGNPPPVWTPYLETTGNATPTIDAIPVGTDPPDPIVSAGGITPATYDGHYYAALHFVAAVDYTSTEIVVADFGWRFAYTGDAPTVDVLVQAEQLTQRLGTASTFSAARAAALATKQEES